MSRKRRTAFIVLGVFILCMGGLATWQWNNISAALSFVRFSQDELEGKLTENDQTIKDVVDEIPNVTIRDVTQEEKDALKEGTLTQEELVQSLIQTNPKQEEKPEKEPESKPAPEASKPETKPDSQTEQPTAQPEVTTQQSDYEKRLNELIAKVYVLREEFLIKLDNTQAAAIADYKAMPAEQRTTKNVASLVSRYLSKGLDMEKECDAQIEQIVVEMETLLKANGGDLNIAQTVYDTYVEEKSLKKAWYMAELKKRGMM